MRRSSKVTRRCSRKIAKRNELIRQREEALQRYKELVEWKATVTRIVKVVGTIHSLTKAIEATE